MKPRPRIIPACLVIAALSGGMAQAQSTPAEKRDDVTFRPWVGTLGVRFHSERLFEETSFAPFPGDRSTVDELSGQATAAGLQGFGFGGEWRPFGNGFRLNFAMYLDSIELAESRGFRSWKLPEADPASDDLVIPVKDFEAVVPYLGLGWKTNVGLGAPANGGGLDVNFDVGAFFPGEASLRRDACLNPDTPLTRCGTTSLGDGGGKPSGSARRFEWHPVVSLGIEYRF